MLRWIALLALCACAAKPPACSVAASVPPRGAPLLWRVSKEGGATVWLSGTIHNEGDKDAMRERSRIDDGPGIDQQLATDDWWLLAKAGYSVERAGWTPGSPPPRPILSMGRM